MLAVITARDAFYNGMQNVMGCEQIERGRFYKTTVNYDCRD